MSKNNANMAKNDMNRVGVFQEMSYITTGDPYVPKYKSAFNEQANKGKQMLPGPVKDRVTALQDGYFTKPFARVFDKESYSDPISLRRRARVDESKKNVTNKPFITFRGPIEPEGLGSNYGTFTGNTEYFSGKTREGKPRESEKPNVKTNPSKKGTGYGYTGVTLDKYPENKPSNFFAADQKAREDQASHKKATVGAAFKSGKYHKEYFDKSPFYNEKDGKQFKDKDGKKQAEKPFKFSSPPKSMGNLDGFYTKFPGHMTDPWHAVNDYKPIKKIVNNTGKLFTPQQGPKSKPQESVINKNVKIHVNSKNFKNAMSYSAYNLPAVQAN